MSSTARVLRVPSSITRAKRCEPTLTGRIQSALSTVRITATTAAAGYLKSGVFEHEMISLQRG
jgi:hypothetical protein